MSQEHLKKKDENQSTLVLYISHEVAKEFCFVFYPRFDVFSRRKKRILGKEREKKKNKREKTKKTKKNRLMRARKNKKKKQNFGRATTHCATTSCKFQRFNERMT